MSQQTLKASLQSRVINAQTERLSSQRQNLGEGLPCPAGSGNIHHDVYGRPVTQNTLVLRDSACSHFLIDAAEYMQYETNLRPHLPICAAGLRGASDMAGWGRDIIPQNLYNSGYNPSLSPDQQDLGNFRGNFERTYGTPNNAPPQAKWPLPRAQPYDKWIPSWDLGMNGQQGAFAGR